MSTMPLTVREVEAARPRPKPYGVADGIDPRVNGG